MNPLDLLNLLFEYSVFHLYAPIISGVGFSHPFTFFIIAFHNTFSLTYLLLAAAVAYSALRERTWLVPAGVTTMWIVVSINFVATLKVPAANAIAAVLPHGWLEFTAIVYWTNAIRKAARGSSLPSPANTPALKDYLRASTNPKKLLDLAKTDIQTSFTAAKLSFRTLFRSLKKSFLITLFLIAAAALIETYVTPSIVLLINGV